MDWYLSHYRPDRVVIDVTGDFDLRSYSRILRSVGGKRSTQDAEWPRISLPEKTALKGAITSIPRPGASDIAFAMGRAVMSPQSLDYVPFVLATRILGGTSESRLRTILRQKYGLTYDISSEVIPGADRTVWDLSATIGSGAFERAATEVFRQIRAIQSTAVGPAELEEAKSSVIGDLALSLADGSKRQMYRMEQISLGLPDSWWSDYVRKVREVVPQDIQRVARTYLDPMTISVVITSNQGNLERAARVWTEETSISH
jgi:zinc protease